MWTKEQKENLKKVHPVNGKNNYMARKVECLETNMVFDYMGAAADWAQCSRGNLTSCCKGNRKHAGCHPETKKLLTWRYINV